MNKISDKIEKVKELIQNADYVLIGAGAGLSTSAGIEYSGKRFEDNFADFIKNIILQICTHQDFMIFKQRKKSGLIGLNICISII